MNNKNIVLYTVIVIAIIGLFVGVGFNMKKHDKPSSNTVALNFGEVANMSKIDYEIPKFSVEIYGDYSGTLDKDLLDRYEIQVYEFDAAVDNGWDVVTNRYIGVKFKDIIDVMIQSNPYNRFMFHSKYDRSDTFLKDQITDNTYLVFTRDGKPIGDVGSVTLLAIDYKYKYSVEALTKIMITAYDAFEEPPVMDESDYIIIE